MGHRYFFRIAVTVSEPEGAHEPRLWPAFTGIGFAFKKAENRTSAATQGGISGTAVIKFVFDGPDFGVIAENEFFKIIDQEFLPFPWWESGQLVQIQRGDFFSGTELGKFGKGLPGRDVDARVDQHQLHAVEPDINGAQQFATAITYGGVVMDEKRTVATQAQRIGRKLFTAESEPEQVVQQH